MKNVSITKYTVIYLITANILNLPTHIGDAFSAT